MTDLATPATLADGSDTAADAAPDARSGRAGGPAPPGSSASPVGASELDDVLTARERQTAARNAYRASVESGSPLTGADLGRRFGRTARWGRMQISAARAELNAGAPSSKNRSGPRPTGNAQQISRAPAVGGEETLDYFQQGRQAVRGRPSSAGNDHLGRSADANSPTQQPARNRRGQAWLDSTITIAVALVAAAASYGHMLDVALVAGEPLWIARAFPVTVDGLVLAAIRRGPDGRRWLALAAAVSIAANVLAQYPDYAAAAGPIVSAWPPLALYGTHRLLHARPNAERPRQLTEEEKPWLERGHQDNLTSWIP